MRWRKVKQGKQPKTTPKLDPEGILIVPIISRFKAWIVDIFMVYIPLLYITTYLILDGKDAFQSNQLAIFADTAVFGLILAFFWAKNGQSPGLRAYDLRLIDIKTKTCPTFLRSLWRYFAFLLAGASVVGLLLAFFRKDKKNLHDLLSHTIVTN